MTETAPGGRTSLELRDYLRVIRRRWRLLALVTILIAGAIFGYTQTRPAVYHADATVLLDAGYARTIIYADSNIIPSIDEQATTEFDLMRSASIMDAIAERLGYKPSVEINSLRPSNDEEKTRAIVVTGSGSSAEEAAKSATDFSRTFVEVRRELLIEDITRTIDQTRENLIDLDQEVAEVQAEIDAVKTAIAANPPAAELRVLEARLRRLETAASSSTINQRQADFTSRIDILESALDTMVTARAIFRVSPAEPPGAPVTPVPKRDAAIALAVGLAIGLCVIFLRDYYDDSLRTKDDLDRATDQIPVLSLVPDSKRKTPGVIESLAHPRSATAEAYRNLRTALEFASINHKIALVHVTSSLPGEGKTTTAANLAVTMANADKRVVLVDCDLRRPRVHEYFDLPNDQGFTSVLLGNCSLQDALQRPANTSNVLVLTSGPPPPNPSELLSTRTAEDLLTTLTQPADIVIIDSPPLLPVSDSIILAGYAHSTLLVVAARSTSRRSLGRSLEMLSQVDAPLEGIVFNRTDAEASYTGGYGYGYGYEYSESSPSKSWLRKP